MSPQGSIPVPVSRPRPAVCAAMRSSMFEQGFYVLSTAVMTPSRCGVTVGASDHQLSHRAAQGNNCLPTSSLLLFAEQFLLSCYKNNKDREIA